MVLVYYESTKREPKIRGIYECRCDERLQTKTKEFTRLPYTEWHRSPVFGEEKKGKKKGFVGAQRTGDQEDGAELIVEGKEVRDKKASDVWAREKYDRVCALKSVGSARGRGTKNIGLTAAGSVCSFLIGFSPFVARRCGHACT